MTQIQNTYYVGKNETYKTVNQVIDLLSNIFNSGNFSLPSTSLPDGGNVNIILVGGGLHAPFRLPNSFTYNLTSEGRYLVIKRLEYNESGEVNSSSLPIISPNAPGASETLLEHKTIAVNLGENNSNVKIQGLRIQDAIIGISASFNTDNLYIERSFITNCRNTQIYVHDSSNVYIINNLVVGGEYGIVAKFCNKLRVYHNTVFLDGFTALGGEVKAGMILQGERLFAQQAYSTLYCLGNLVHTMGGPGVVFYKEDLDNNRLVSDYNNFYNPNGPIVQLRQDNAILEDDETEIVHNGYVNLVDWKNVGEMGSLGIAIDLHSISTHPVFIQNLSNLGISNTSLLDLNLINNSPILEKVPAWYSLVDENYIPLDFDEILISRDSLLNVRQTPYTAIGANDAVSLNGFFGQDIFTSPLLFDPEKICDLDPFQLLTKQELTMLYPKITAGYFWSHERPYYLYGKKGACQLGYLAKTEFILPGNVSLKHPVEVKARGLIISPDNYTVYGKTAVVYHREHGLVSYEDEVTIECKILTWANQGFGVQDAYYVFKVKDSKLSFILDSNYNPEAPVVITDDRVSYKDPVDLTQREFAVTFSEEQQETIIDFNCDETYVKNLILNSIFAESTTYQLPALWHTTVYNESNPRVLMLGSTFSYFGDYAVGLKIDDTVGWIDSNYVDFKTYKPLTFSWHSKLPLDITVRDEPLTEATCLYEINLFDKKNELLVTEGGLFTVASSKYQRYYVTINNSEELTEQDLQSVDGTPLIKLELDIEIPDNAAKATIKFSGIHQPGVTTNSFFMLDAIQAEHSKYPTYFQPEPSLDGMTVEWETSEDSLFIDKRMNITSVFNENPNGFLYITDMPASLWGGPKHLETTTLHEYRWPAGRIDILPWARLHGKDKLRQKIFFSELPDCPLDIISPYNRPKTAREASMVPSVVRAVQNSNEIVGLSMRVIDNVGNSYPLRKYSISVIEEEGQFPGWLSKKYLGAKEQLGSTVYGKLSSNGSANVFYIPPGPETIKYIGNTPPVLYDTEVLSGQVDSISFIDTAYKVSLENNGNITILGRSGEFHQTYSDGYITGDYYPESIDNKVVVNLEYPPVFGSLSLTRNGVPFYETQGDPQRDEFFVSYSYGQLELQNGLPTDIPMEIVYKPRYVYPDPLDPRVIIVHHNYVFGDYNGPIQVDYDAELIIELRTENLVTGEFVATFPVILQNPSLANTVNDLELEY